MKRLLYAIAACICTVALIYGSLLPFSIHYISPPQAAYEFYRQFFDTTAAPSAKDVMLNIGCYLPFGFLWLSVSAINRRSSFPALVCVAVGAAALSLSIEFVQVWIHHRVPSQFDTAANIAGALVGAMMVPLLHGLLGHCRMNPRLLVRAGIVLTGLFYGAGIAQHFMQGCVAPSCNQNFAPRLVLFLGSPTDANFFYSSLLHVLFSLPLGVWLFQKSRQYQSATRIVLPGLLLVVVLFLAEWFQAFVGGRAIEVWDVCCSVSGVAVGMLGCRLWCHPIGIFCFKRRHASPLPLVTIGYGCFLAVLLWFPYRFDISLLLVNPLDRIDLLPFTGMQNGSYQNALVSLAMKPLLFVPLGGLLVMLLVAAAGRRQIAVQMTITLLLGTAFGLFLEAGQLLQPGRVADIADVLLYSVGTLAGAVCGALAFEYSVQSYLSIPAAARKDETALSKNTAFYRANLQ